MSASTFMHGPWHFAGSGIIANDDDEEIGLSAVYDDDPNGKLIIAAPDLCAALDGLLDGLDANHTGYGEGISQEAWDRRIEAARAAMRKAGAL